MNLKKFRYFIARLEAESPELFPGFVSLQALYRYQGGWFEAKSKRPASDVDSQRADRVSKLPDGVGRAKKEVGCCLYVADFDAVVQITLVSAPQKPSQLRLRRSLLKVVESSKDSFRSSHDKLTGLGNQDAFEAALASALEVRSPPALTTAEGQGSAVRTDAVALLALDLDHFKSVNDRFGHQHGDAVLAAFGWRLERVCDEFTKRLKAKAVARSFRPGGEEFFVLVSGEVGSEDALMLANSICETTRSQVLPSDDEYSVLEVDAGVALSEMPHISERKITVSCGVSITPRVEKALVRAESSRIKKQADTALYSAKVGGRDRVRLFDEILKAHGRLAEIHQHTGVIAIDIGKDVGVKKGQEFHVVPPDFSGDTPFYFGDGRARKRLGSYPRLRVGRISVFDVQREVSFCRETFRAEGVVAFEVGSTLEAIPLGSVAHLLTRASGDPGVGLGTIDHLREALQEDPLRPRSVVSCLVKDFESLTSERGFAFANQVLAALVQEMYSAFGARAKVAQSALGNLLAVTAQPEEARVVSNRLFEVLQSIQERFGHGVDVVFGFWPGPAAGEDGQLESPSPGIANVEGALDFAVAASTVAAGVGESAVIGFDSDVVFNLLWLARRDNKYDRGIADFERFEALGFATPDLLNQVGLIYREKNPPSLERAEFYLRRAVADWGAVSATVTSNLAIVLFEQGEYSDAVSIFREVIAAGKSIPDAYIAAYILACRRTMGADVFRSMIQQQSALIEVLRQHKSRQVAMSIVDDSEVDELIREFSDQ